MSEDWSRRALLASLGTLAFAGCIADPPSGETDGATSATETPSSTGATDPTTTRPGDPTTPERIESEWPTPASDAGRSNYNPDASGPTEQVAELWNASTDTVLSAPVLADGTLYVGGRDGAVRAFDARTGERRWRRSVGTGAETPWVAGDLLCVPADGETVALDTDDGTERWRVDTPSRAGILVASHGVYCLLDRPDPVVVALALKDGGERWRTTVRDPWTPRLFASETSVYVSTGSNGRVPWTLDVESGDVVGDRPESGYDFSAEWFYSDGTRFDVDAFFGQVEAAAVEDDGYSWSQGDVPTGGKDAGVLSGGANRVYYTSNTDDSPGLYALSMEDGAIAWTADVPGTIATVPVAATETVLVGTDEMLHCFDPADGAERWARSIEGVGDQFVVVDDLVYATQDETVRALRPP